MQRIIQGKTYETETAPAFMWFRLEPVRTVVREKIETLYRTRNGTWFYIFEGAWSDGTTAERWGS